MDSGRTQSCALRADGTAECWGYNVNSGEEPPPGRFVDVFVGNSHTCGLRESGALTCWGSSNPGRPQEMFAAIADGVHSCGLLVDGTVTCWGFNEFGAADAPSGEFTAISVGWDYSCGVRTDGTIDCWGLQPVLPPPDGVELVRPR